jgi:hypothetical protein
MSACRAGYGAALLAAPAQLLAAAAGVQPGAAGCRVARLLGARQLIQAGLSATGSRPVLRLGAATDGLHSASMLALAAASPRLRRAALTEAAIAAALAWAGLRSCPSDGT